MTLCMKLDDYEGLLWHMAKPSKIKMSHTSMLVYVSTQYYKLHVSALTSLL